MSIPALAVDFNQSQPDLSLSLAVPAMSFALSHAFAKPSLERSYRDFSAGSVIFLSLVSVPILSMLASALSRVLVATLSAHGESGIDHTEMDLPSTIPWASITAISTALSFSLLSLDSAW